MPYISMTVEKTEKLKLITDDINIKTAALYSESEHYWSPALDLIICTPEKTNSILNRLFEEYVTKGIDPKKD